MALPRHIRVAGIRAIEQKLAKIYGPSSQKLKEQLTDKLDSPSSESFEAEDEPKVVKFPSS